MELQEFKHLKYERDKYYFDNGFASYNVYWGKKKFYVNAIYRNDVLMQNEQTKDYSNGIKGFELLDDKYKFIAKFKVNLKSTIANLKDVEMYIIRNY